MLHEADSDTTHSHTIPYIQLNMSCVNVLNYCYSMGFVYNDIVYTFYYLHYIYVSHSDYVKIYYFVSTVFSYIPCICICELYEQSAL